MFQSALRSEVLRSETLRIISVDNQEQTQDEVFHDLWLELRAVHLGRPFRAPPTWSLRREQQDTECRQRRLLGALVAEILMFEVGPSSDGDDPRLTKEHAVSQVSQILDLVDAVEQHFPSVRAMAAANLQWASAAVQNKLATLYAWHNCFSLLQCQKRILQTWTGSPDLDIFVHLGVRSPREPYSPPTTCTAHERPMGLSPAERVALAAANGDATLGATPLAQEQGERIGPLHLPTPAAGEDGMLIERLMRGHMLHNEFQKRTLRYHSGLLLKAGEAIKEYHELFTRWGLPSFQRELIQLGNFPVALLEGALRMHLNYALKLQSQPPGLAIADTLLNNIRATLALACHVKNSYLAFIAPDPAHGWSLPGTDCLREDTTFDRILREALDLFFDLIDFKLKASPYSKETEILEPEWAFLATAASSIHGGDTLVAKRITRIVTQLFIRIEHYFRREMSVPVLPSEVSTRLRPRTPSIRSPPKPKTAGGLTKGKQVMDLRETKGWMKAVLDNVRIRSRRLLSFSSDIRGRLDNAAEYDLSVLSAPKMSPAHPPERLGAGEDCTAHLSLPSDTERMDAFLTTLADAGFVQIDSPLATRELYILASQLPACDPDAKHVLDLLTKCLRSPGLFSQAPWEADNDEHARPSRFYPFYPAFDAHFNVWGDDALQKLEEYRRIHRAGRQPHASPDQSQHGAEHAAAFGSASRLVGQSAAGSTARGYAQDESEGTELPGNHATAPRYLLLLSLPHCYPFVWRGRSIHLGSPITVDMHMSRYRLRLVADGSRAELQSCKDHLYRIFANARSASAEPGGNARSASARGLGVSTGTTSRTETAFRGQRDDPRRSASCRSAFPLPTVSDFMAHIHSVQKEVTKINQGIYTLARAIIHEVPRQRQRLHFQRADVDASLESPAPAPIIRVAAPDAGRHSKDNKGGVMDELIQQCYELASGHALRSLPFIVSPRMRAEMTILVSELATDWLAFITDDCVSTDRKTFKWAVTALEHASIATLGDNVLRLDPRLYTRLQHKVSLCMRLLISHFDVLGARSSIHTRLREVQEKFELDQIERTDRDHAAWGIGAPAAIGTTLARSEPPRPMTQAEVAATILLSSDLRAHVSTALSKANALDDDRATYLRAHQLMGRVLDSSRIEDQGLRLLASARQMSLQWQADSVVGIGSFGTVYRALDMEAGTLMAVKEIRFRDIALHPAFFTDTRDEMRVMQTLDYHPNIVRFFGLEVHRDKVFFFMELCEGGSLATGLELGPISDERIVQLYALQMLDGLIYLHSKGIVHCDIKPENILLDHSGVLKFVDFGSAKILPSSDMAASADAEPTPVTVVASAADSKATEHDSSQLEVEPSTKASTKAGPRGTPMYMSPEELSAPLYRSMGAGDVSKTDIWALGCVLLQCVTGQRPWAHLDNVSAIMFNLGIAQDHPPLPNPDQLSPEGIDFLRLCFTIDPRVRPTATALRSHPWIARFIFECEHENLLETMDADDSTHVPAATSMTSLADEDNDSNDVIDSPALAHGLGPQSPWGGPPFIPVPSPTIPVFGHAPPTQAPFI